MSKQSFLRGKFVSRFAHVLSREHTAGLWNLLFCCPHWLPSKVRPSPPSKCARKPAGLSDGLPPLVAHHFAHSRPGSGRATFTSTRSC